MDTLPIINRTYDLYKQIIDITEHLTKRWRLTLGKSIEDTVFGLLSELIMAKNAPEDAQSGLPHQGVRPSGDMHAQISSLS